MTFSNIDICSTRAVYLINFWFVLCAFRFWSKCLSASEIDILVENCREKNPFVAPAAPIIFSSEIGWWFVFSILRSSCEYDAVIDNQINLHFMLSAKFTWWNQSKWNPVYIFKCLHNFYMKHMYIRLNVVFIEFYIRYYIQSLLKFNLQQMILHEWRMIRLQFFFYKF